MPLLVGDMRETATPAALADAMLARVEAGVRARHGAVIAGDILLDVRDVAPEAVAEWLAHDAALAQGVRLWIFTAAVRSRAKRHCQTSAG